MEKIVHLFEVFKTIFLCKFFELGKAIFEVVENSNDLNQFEFEFKLNLTRRHYSRGPLISARPPLLGVAPCARAARSCPSATGRCLLSTAVLGGALSPPVSLPCGLRPGPPSPSPAARMPIKGIIDTA
jgi:hypothetical protein